MRPIRARSGSGETNQQTDAAETATLSARRGRHRKPSPRKVLLAAGGLALAAGVLSLVRAAPESGVGAPDTAQAEPRLDPSGGATARSTDTAATMGTARTTRPSATSAMGGVSAAPTAPAETDDAVPGRSATATHVPPPSGTGAPTTGPRRTDPATAAPHSSPPAPVPTRTAPAPAPTPSRGTTAPPTWDDGLCLPVIGLCVDVPGGGQD